MIEIFNTVGTNKKSFPEREYSQKLFKFLKSVQRPRGIQKNNLQPYNENINNSIDYPQGEKCTLPIVAKLKNVFSYKNSNKTVNNYENDDYNFENVSKLHRKSFDNMPKSSIHLKLNSSIIPAISEKNNKFSFDSMESKETIINDHIKLTNELIKISESKPIIEIKHNLDSKITIEKAHEKRVETTKSQKRIIVFQRRSKGNLYKSENFTNHREINNNESNYV